MSIATKPVIVCIALLTTNSAIANINKSNSVSIEEITKEDNSYDALVTEIVEASPSSLQLLSLSSNHFSNIAVRKETTRIVEGKKTTNLAQKSYSTCALDQTFGFSYNVEASWSSNQVQPKTNLDQQMPQWTLTSYKAKRRTQPCNA